jgi:hypothetical protein
MKVVPLGDHLAGEIVVDVSREVLDDDAKPVALQSPNGVHVFRINASNSKPVRKICCAARRWASTAFIIETGTFHEWRQRRAKLAAHPQ